ncbi:MAG: hypothetical protein AAF773_09595 [Cyanobacteria bacterium P01_D01_bin.115]
MTLEVAGTAESAAALNNGVGLIRAIALPLRWLTTMPQLHLA